MAKLWYLMMKEGRILITLNYEKKKLGQIVFYVFDLLWIEGYNIMNEPLHKRRSLLAELIPDNGGLNQDLVIDIDEIGKRDF